MKIDAELRMAIRSAERSQPQSNWESRQKAEGEAVQAFLKSRPSVAKQVAAASKRLKRCATVEAKVREVFNRYGLATDCAQVRDSDVFTKAGGKLPSPPHRRWEFDKVMAELAAAKPAQARVILKRLNILWK